MKKENAATNPEETKLDLKHDTMEFAASADGDDKLDTDDSTYEAGDITSEELDKLEEDDFEGQAYALNSAETDKQADEDTLPEEDWLDDLPDNDTDEEEEENPRH